MIQWFQSCYQAAFGRANGDSFSSEAMEEVPPSTIWIGKQVENPSSKTHDWTEGYEMQRISAHVKPQGVTRRELHWCFSSSNAGVESPAALEDLEARTEDWTFVTEDPTNGAAWLKLTVNVDERRSLRSRWSSFLRWDQMPERDWRWDSNCDIHPYGLGISWNIIEYHGISISNII